MYRKYYLRYKSSMTHSFALNWLSLLTVLSSKCKSSLWQQQHLQREVEKLGHSEDQVHRTQDAWELHEGSKKKGGGVKRENKIKAIANY